MCKCVRYITYSKMLIFHMKYVQMWSPLIQNVNIPFEICANVFGSLMDPYKDLPWICIWILWIPMWILYGSSICKCVYTWSKILIYYLQYVQMCQGETGGAAWIPIRIHMDPYLDRIWMSMWILYGSYIYVNVFTADQKC